MNRHPAPQPGPGTPDGLGGPPATVYASSRGALVPLGHPAMPDAPTGLGPCQPVTPARGLVHVSGRLVLGTPRGRGLPSIDVVGFTAACPACGRDVEWIEEREETRLRIIIECPCTR